MSDVNITGWPADIVTASELFPTHAALTFIRQLNWWAVWRLVQFIKGGWHQWNMRWILNMTPKRKKQNRAKFGENCGHTFFYYNRCFKMWRLFAIYVHCNLIQVAVVLNLRLPYINQNETQEPFDPWTSSDPRTHEESSPNWGVGMPETSSIISLTARTKQTTNKTNFVAWVRERTIPTERPQPVGEVSANFCG
jgi:hypothetical protein